MKKQSKYRAVKTVVDGITFSSKAEARRYGELKLLEKAGKISYLNLQVRYPLRVNDKVIGHYVADFEYYDKATRSIVIEDVKGMKTPLYSWKKRHFEAQSYHKIVEITK